MTAQGAAKCKTAKISQRARDQIVLDHLPLVKAIAICAHEGLPVHVDLDGLIHAGVIGLFDAVTKFDNTKNVVFHAYAKHRIKGAILDSLRQLDWASRDLRKRQKKVDSVIRELSTKLGRTPNDCEVAEQMGVGMDRWRRMQMEMRTVGPVSATPPPDQEADRSKELAAAPDSQPDHMCERRELQSTLAHAIGCLPKRSQKVVSLYYTKDMTMKEIGDVLGVNESRVSQIHKTALMKMSVVLESEGIHSVSTSVRRAEKWCSRKLFSSGSKRTAWHRFAASHTFAGTSMPLGSERLVGASHRGFTRSAVDSSHLNIPAPRHTSEPSRCRKRSEASSHRKPRDARKRPDAGKTVLCGLQNQSAR